MDNAVDTVHGGGEPVTRLQARLYPFGRQVTGNWARPTAHDPDGLIGLDQFVDECAAEVPRAARNEYCSHPCAYACRHPLVSTTNGRSHGEAVALR